MKKLSVQHAARARDTSLSHTREPHARAKGIVALKAVVVGALVCTTTCVTAQGVAGQDVDASEIDEAREITLPPRIELADLIALASREAGVSLEIPAGTLRGQIELRLERPVTPDELWRLTRSVLETQNLVVIESPVAGVYSIRQRQQVGRGRLLLPGESPLEIEGRVDPLVSTLTAITRVRSSRPAELIQVVLPLVQGDGVTLQTVGDEGLLLLSGPVDGVYKALDTLQLFDRVPTEYVTERIEVASADVASLQSLLETLLALEAERAGGRTSDWRFIPVPGQDAFLVNGPADELAGLRALVVELDQPPILETRVYTEPSVLASELAGGIQELLEGAEVRIVAESLTGTVLVTASPSTHTRIEQFIERIRARPGDGLVAFESFIIKNRDADELRATIESLLTREALGGSGSIGQRAAGQPSIFRGNSTPVVQLTVDEGTNSLLASGPPASLRRVAELVTQLDRRRPQVMLEATLVTLSEGESLDLGTELTFSFSSGETEANIGSLFGSGLDVDSGVAELGSGLVGLVLNPGDFSVLSRALSVVTDGRDQSEPKVLVNDGATGTLRSVERQPFTSINASDTVATTSFGGTEDAGTTVTVTPQIAEGDHLILDYQVELSTFIGDSTTLEGGGVIPPPSVQNSLSGQVTIPDGFTVVLGGIRDTNRGFSRSGIPVLSRIPVVSWLFGVESDSRSSSRFYVFLTAHILRDPLFRDLRHLSSIEREGAAIPGDAPPMAPLWIH